MFRIETGEGAERVPTTRQTTALGFGRGEGKRRR